MIRGAAAFHVFLLALLLQACRPSPPALQLVRKTVIDESSIVLRSLPRKVVLQDDSTAALLAGGKLVVYNLGSGKVLRSFSRLSVDLDSLVRATFGKAAADSIEYVTIGGRLLDEPEYADMVTMFDCDRGAYTILCAVPVEYRYKDAVALKRMLRTATGDTARLRALMADSTLLLSTTQLSFCPFFVRTDAQLHVQSIVPYYMSAAPKTRYGQYIALLDYGFRMWGDTLYCQAFDQESDFYNMPGQLIHTRDSLTLAGSLVVNAHEARWNRELLNTAQVPAYAFPAGEYARRAKSFCRTDKNILLLTEAGLYDLAAKKPWPLQPVLHDSEGVYGDFDAGDDYLLYTATKIRTGVADGGKPVMSRLRLSDGQAAVLSDTLINGAVSFGSMHRNYVFVMRDDDHYYFMHYALR